MPVPLQHMLLLRVLLIEVEIADEHVVLRVHRCEEVFQRSTALFDRVRCVVTGQVKIDQIDGYFRAQAESGDDVPFRVHCSPVHSDRRRRK